MKIERENIYRGGQLLAVYEAFSSCYKSIADFVTAFYQGVLSRNPTSTELSQWTNTLSQAQARGHAQLIAAAQSLGTTIFTSSEYTSLNMRVATQDIWNPGYGYSVTFETTSPVTGSEYMVYNGLIARRELDPLGTDVTSPPEPLLQQEPIFYNSKFSQMPLEYEWGPSSEARANVAEYEKRLALILG